MGDQIKLNSTHAQCKHGRRAYDSKGISAAVTFEDRYLMGNYNFFFPEDFQRYLDELKSSIDGNVNTEVNVTQETGIITLSTCIGDSPSQRWMVNATKE